MTDPADTIRRFVGRCADEDPQPILAALDALLAERQQAQEEIEEWRAEVRKLSASWDKISAERQQAQEERDEALTRLSVALAQIAKLDLRLIECRDQRRQAIDALREPLEPCGDFPSKLEWLAYWLDSVDVLIEALPDAEPLGRDVQHDLRRWAEQWRALVKLGEKP